MCVALVGGMERLKKHYEEEATKAGIELKVFNTWEPKLATKVRAADVVVLFTNKISHTARREVMSAAKAARVPVHAVHSCGLCTLRDCIRCVAGCAGPQPV